MQVVESFNNTRGIESRCTLIKIASVTQNSPELSTETRLQKHIQIFCICNYQQKHFENVESKVQLPLNVLKSLTMKLQFDSIIICFSLRMCCCCRVSTIWAFFITFKAKLLDVSVANVTSSTLPNPPTPKVATFRKSESSIWANCSLSLKRDKKV